MLSKFVDQYGATFATLSNRMVTRYTTNMARMWSSCRILRFPILWEAFSVMRQAKISLARSQSSAICVFSASRPSNFCSGRMKLIN